MRIITKSQWIGSNTAHKRHKGPPAGVVEKQQKAKREKEK